MSKALIQQNQAVRTIDFLPEAVIERDAAMEACALVSVVRNQDENESANAAMTALHGFLAKVEKARVMAKRPALEECRQIDDLVATFVKDAKAEQVRINKVIGDYLTLEDAKRRDAELARRRDLEELERQKREAMAQAQSHEQREATQAQFEGLKASVPAPPPQPQVKGQSARPRWEIEITDIHALYRAYPHTVKMEPKMLEIQSLLERLPEGQSLPGVIAQRVIKPQVTGQRHGKVLELERGTA